MAKKVEAAPAAAPAATAAKKASAPRLYVKGVVTSFRRGKRTQDNGMAIVKLQGVQDKKDTAFYAGKRICYIYKGTSTKNGAKFRSIWGRIGNPHGANGAVKAKFSPNLPGKALGGAVRIMLYPSRV